MKREREPYPGDDLGDEVPRNERGAALGLEIFPGRMELRVLLLGLDEASESYLEMKRREEAGEDLTEEWAEIHRKAKENYQKMLRGSGEDSDSGL